MGVIKITRAVVLALSTRDINAVKMILALFKMCYLCYEVYFDTNGIGCSKI